MGRDVFSRLVRGAQISLTVGIISTTFAAVIGVFLGMCAGYYGKFIGNIIMRITDLIMCYPFIITSVIAAAIIVQTMSPFILNPSARSQQTSYIAL